eukprot:CAMPEP_0195077550 /NCGR_PEP_ID=MMETSP0448-20130528/19958_1 /TAXON_ID=66468 /ORGANISM="Heterocapsa triquestra, Strain CCMP 448" /LENGTH=296 /DNA_ID=CAMNT_0040110203 /DNA_START=6 /DNA_END=896 /DNA_ORIENTATION=-
MLVIEAVDIPCERWDANRFQPMGKLSHGAELYRDLVLDKDVVATKVCSNCPESIKNEQEGGSPKWSSSVTAVQTTEGEVVLLAAACKPESDLWAYSQALGLPGPEREARATQVLRSLLSEVCCLHEHGIAHGNLCLENVLVLAPADSEEDAPLKVSLTDFTHSKQGQGILSAKGPSGKLMYVAPEAHQDVSYDARAADLFACGVIAYSLMVGEYPFMSTAPGRCKAFSYLHEQGPEALLAKRTCKSVLSNRKVRVADCISANCANVISLLLSLVPSHRASALDLLAERTDRGSTGA